MIRLLDDGRIIVVVNGRRWNYNPSCLFPVADEHASEGEDLLMHIIQCQFMYSLGLYWPESAVLSSH